MKLTLKKMPLVAILLSFISVAGLSVPSMAVQLVPHRIIYDLTLKEATSRSGITALAGRIVYEFRGSQCDGYTVNFRSVNEIFTGDMTRVSDQQSSFYENNEDGTFSFMNRTFVNLQLDRQSSGKAEQFDKELLVQFKSDDKDDIVLPQSQFPTENLIDLIKRAQEGKRIYESRVFDGSDGGEKSMMTTSIIGDFRAASSANTNGQDWDDKDKAEIDILGTAAKGGYWPVSVSYFEETDDGDTLPVYRFAFKLYENGISRDLTMDHGYVVIDGKVAGFELLDEETCD